MEKTPKSMRLQIGIFGRTNVGKSSFINMVANQDVSITSEIPGTTTDVVEKSMELLPIGPVVLLDTAGVDDTTEIAELRINKSRKILSRADAAVLIVLSNEWTEYETKLVEEFKSRNIPFLIAINQIDRYVVDTAFVASLQLYCQNIMLCAATDITHRDTFIKKFKELLAKILPVESFHPTTILGDLIPEKNGLIVFIVPIDMEAPKGRIILPQVQSLRDALDNSAVSVVVKETEYLNVYNVLNRKPDLVVCDSQVVDKMIAETPPDVKCTTFSILFSRYKGDLHEEIKGCRKLKELTGGDRVLIAEACSHHAMEDDIGRIKIPRWLEKYTYSQVIIDTYAGRDYPENLSEYDLVLHCGGCMITRNEKLRRIRKAVEANVPITNYGLAISLMHGHLERVLEPFPEALKILKGELV